MISVQLAGRQSRLQSPWWLYPGIETGQSSAVALLAALMLSAKLRSKSKSRHIMLGSWGSKVFAYRITGDLKT